MFSNILPTSILLQARLWELNDRCELQRNDHISISEQSHWQQCGESEGRPECEHSNEEKMSMSPMPAEIGWRRGLQERFRT